MPVIPGQALFWCLERHTMFGPFSHPDEIRPTIDRGSMPGDLYWQWYVRRKRRNAKQRARRDAVADNRRE